MKLGTDTCLGYDKMLIRFGPAILNFGATECKMAKNCGDGYIMLRLEVLFFSTVLLVILDP